ncbi:MAG: ABC transporter permease [Synergistaceae bacterium]|nr:ABC transporter permease [Synergistaceae bacterium]
MKFEKDSLLTSGLVLPSVLLLLWWTGSMAGWWNAFLLPSPEKVFDSFVMSIQDGDLQKHVWASLERIIKGFGLSAVMALSLALVCSWFPALLVQLEPTLEFLRHIPPMSVIPMLILWFGIGEAPKIILIILATFFPVFMNVLQGIRDCDPKLIEVAKVFGYKKWDQFKYVILPSAVPSILTGLRLGLGYSWRSLVAAELVAASSGLGYMILDAEQLSRSDVVLMGIFVIGALGAFLDYGFLWAIKRYLKRGIEA